MEHRDIIKKIILELRTTQSVFADSIGENYRKINNIASGNRNISPEIALKISEKYGFSFKWIMTGEGEMYEKTKDEKKASKLEAVWLKKLDLTEQQLDLFLSFVPDNDEIILLFIKALRGNTESLAKLHKLLNP